jgi:hypothetical protein
MKKSFIPPAFRSVRMGGQVPTRDNLQAMRLVNRQPPAFKPSMLLEHTEPVMRIDGITKGLGFDPARKNSWNKFLDDQLNGGVNELVLRKAIHQRMLEERMEPEMRKAIFQRSMSYFRDQMTKSLVHVVTPDEILEKAEARGGTYHRRTPRKNGKGFTYYYDADKYASSKDAHLSGAEARDSRIKKAVSTMLGEKTECTPDDMKDLVKKFGAKEVAGVLKKQCGDGGSMEFKNGKFKAKSLEKSRRLDPDFRFVLGRGNR